MPFSSLLFVHLFLPAFLLLAWVVPARLKNAVALLASVLFYAWGAPGFLPVVLCLALLDYFLSQAIARARTDPNATNARLLLAGGVATHLSVLAYFKYSNFFVGEVNTLFAIGGLRVFEWTNVALPIGVSFITFEEISYLCDVYRGDAQPARKISDYVLFLMLFPHSIAGPIFRWKDLRDQIADPNRLHDWGVVRSGFERFTLGLAKKILIADSVAIIADGAFALKPAQLTTAHAWLGAVAYSVQIYFDFSGYSDMAIGLGLMIGFRFKENFDQPYVSASLAEFWSRWHITLSTWFRDYVYIPLGGNQRRRLRTLANLLAVFVLSGLWHGAAWTFAAWGAYHGALAVLERLYERPRRRLPLWVQHASTVVFVVIGWVLFRANTLGQALEIILAMAGAPGLDPAAPRPPPALLVPRYAAFALAVGVGISLLPIADRYRSLARRPLPARIQGLTRAGFALLFAVTLVHLTNVRLTPLIYFRF